MVGRYRFRVFHALVEVIGAIVDSSWLQEAMPEGVGASKRIRFGTEPKARTRSGSDSNACDVLYNIIESQFRTFQFSHFKPGGLS
jgi:hypothetical protein